MGQKILDAVTGFVGKMFGVLEGFVDGLTSQVRDTRKTLSLLMLTFLTADVIFVGKFGIISFLIDKATAGTAILTSLVEKNGFETIVLLFIVYMIAKDFKKS